MRILDTSKMAVLMVLVISYLSLVDTMNVKAAEAEMEIVESRFRKAGWDTETYWTSLHSVLVVSTSGIPHYLFRFEKWPDGLRGIPTRDPNIRPDRYVGGNPILTFFEVPEWQEMKSIASKLGFEEHEFDALSNTASRMSSVPYTISSSKVRKLTPSESKAILHSIRENNIVQRSIVDASGERFEDLPFDAQVTNAYVLGNVVWIGLHSERDPIFTKYPVIIQLTPFGLRTFFEHANDISELPFKTAFPEVVTIFTGSTGLFPWWNYYGDNQGQAGLWFRNQLRKNAPFNVWTPQEQVSILGKLASRGPTFTGLVYASKNTRAIAQFYDHSGRLLYAEFVEGDLIRTRNLDEAIKHLDLTNSSDIWWCYNGVSQQFGHPDLIQCLYRNRAKSSDR